MPHAHKWRRIKRMRPRPRSPQESTRETALTGWLNDHDRLITTWVCRECREYAQTPNRDTKPRRKDT